MVLSDSQKVFEEHVFFEYFIRHVNKAGVELKDKDTFCAKREDNGDYVDVNVSAMWFGWQLREKATIND